MVYISRIINHFLTIDNITADFVAYPQNCLKIAWGPILYFGALNIMPIILTYIGNNMYLLIRIHH